MNWRTSNFFLFFSFNHWNGFLCRFFVNLPKWPLSLTKMVEGNMKKDFFLSDSSSNQTSMKKDLFKRRRCFSAVLIHSEWADFKVAVKFWQSEKWRKPGMWNETTNLNPLKFSSKDFASMKVLQQTNQCNCKQDFAARLFSANKIL